MMRTEAEEERWGLKKAIRELIGSLSIDDRLIDKALNECDGFAIENISEEIGFQRGEAIRKANDNVLMAEWSRIPESEEKALHQRYEDLNKLASQLTDYLEDACECRMVKR